MVHRIRNTLKLFAPMRHKTSRRRAYTKALSSNHNIPQSRLASVKKSDGTASCYPLPDYEHLLMHTRISKGPVETVQGMKCQEWTTYGVVSGRFAPAQRDNTQICIGLHDDLPRRIKYENAEYIFYDWQIDDRKKSSAVDVGP